MNFIRLARYQLWADQILWELLGSLSGEEMNIPVHPNLWTIREKMEHTMGAIRIWLDRLAGKAADSFPNYSYMSKKELIEEWDALDRELIQKYEDTPQGEINYATTEGLRKTSSTEDVYLHIINHTTHHRSQIITGLRLLGKSVKNTDYIFFTRR